VRSGENLGRVAQLDRGVVDLFAAFAKLLAPGWRQLRTRSRVEALEEPLGDERPP
jgi:hypothetical protein